MTSSEVVRRMLNAFYSGGVDAARAFHDPDITWIERVPRERLLRGSDEVSHGFDELEASGATVVPIARDVIDKGGCAVVPGEMQIRAGGSVRQTQVWWVIRVRDDKVLWGETCLSRAQLDSAVARAADEGQAASGVSSSD